MRHRSVDGGLLLALALTCSGAGASHADTPRTPPPHAESRAETLGETPLRHASPDPSDGSVVTLIMDDMAYDAGLARRTLALPRPFAVSILPDSPYARFVHDEAARHDIDIMLHLPMAANARPRAEATTLSGSMDEETMRASVRRALAITPNAIAVNNHEGSQLTADRAAMEVIIEEIAADQALIFVDSRTTAATVAEEVAAEAGLAATSRDVFLDHDPSAEAVERAFDLWLEIAAQRGCALAIGHPREATLEVLERRLVQLDETVDRVDLATYIERCGY